MISIVVPTKDSPKYLDLTLRALKLHTDGEYELVIVENSTEPELKKESLKVSKETYPDALVVDYHRSDTEYFGCGQAFALGSDVSNAGNDDWLCFVHSDVIVPPHWLKQSLELINFLPEKEILGMAALCGQGIAGGGKPQQMMMATGYPYPLRCPRLVDSCSVFNAGNYRKVGGYDRTFPASGYIDDDLCYRFNKAGYVNFALPVYAMNFGQRSFFVNETRDELANYDKDMVAGLNEMNKRYGIRWLWEMF